MLTAPPYYDEDNKHLAPRNVNLTEEQVKDFLKDLALRLQKVGIKFCFTGKIALQLGGHPLLSFMLPLIHVDIKVYGLKMSQLVEKLQLRGFENLVLPSRFLDLIPHLLDSFNLLKTHTANNANRVNIRFWIASPWEQGIYEIIDSMRDDLFEGIPSKIDTLSLNLRSAMNGYWFTQDREELHIIAQILYVVLMNPTITLSQFTLSESRLQSQIHVIRAKSPTHGANQKCGKFVCAYLDTILEGDNLQHWCKPRQAPVTISSDIEFP